MQTTIRPVPARDAAPLPSLRAGARVARETAARLSQETEREGRLPEAVLDAVRAAGFARHLVPARFGGNEGSYTELAAAVADLGEGCASAAWCASVYAIAGRLAVHLPAEGQAVIWADGPDALIASGIVPAPGAQVRAEEGGWRLTGEWPFASGVHGADWAVVGGLAEVDGAKVFRFFALPADSLTIRRTWDNVGLSGTGSDSVVLSEVFVPDTLSFAFDALLQGLPVGSGAPAHTVPYKLVNGLVFVAPVLGAARGALRHWTEWVAAKRETSGRPTRERAMVQQTLARAAAEVELAETLLMRAAASADLGRTDAETLVRSPLDYTLVAELLGAATDRLMRSGGARAQTRSNPVQRAWRDVHAAAGHVVLQFDAAATGYAEYAFAQFD